MIGFLVCEESEAAYTALYEAEDHIYDVVCKWNSSIIMGSTLHKTAAYLCVHLSIKSVAGHTDITFTVCGLYTFELKILFCWVGEEIADY